MKLHLHQMDVATAHVQGDLPDELYMEQPEYPEKEKDNSKVCKMLKPLYGLKQAGQQWHLKLDEYLRELGMKQLAADPCLYVKEIHNSKILIAVYVDDLLLASDSLDLLEGTKRLLPQKFEMKDMGEVSSILGISVRKDTPTGNVELSQKAYVEKLSSIFNMENAKTVSTPMDSGFIQIKDKNPSTDEEVQEMAQKPYRELVGRFSYLSNTTRPDISYAASMLSRFCNTEAAYMALSEITKEIIHLTALLNDMGIEQFVNTATPIFCDN